MDGARMFYGGKEKSYFLWPVRGRNHDVVRTTGQKYCFDEKGRRISCTGTGQDGEYQYGKPCAENHTMQSKRDILVRDPVTNLHWLKNANLTHEPVSWPQALQAISLLNKQGGSKNWRLPNINELESLVDCAQANPALPNNHLFADVQDAYWSSTTSMFEPDWAWALYLKEGAVGVGQKSGSHFYVWPVSNAD